MKKYFNRWLNAIKPRLHAFYVWKDRSSYVLSIIASYAFIVLLLIAALYIYGPILQLLSPILTLAFVVLCTLATLQKRIATFLSIAGILLYIACWPIAYYKGAFVGQIVCTIGILMWFSSLGLTILPEKKKPIVV